MTRRALGLDGELERFTFTEIATSPHPVEQVEAQISAKGFLDDLTVALPGAGRTYLICDLQAPRSVLRRR